MKLLGDERASSGAFINFLAILVASAALAWMLRELTLPMIAEAQTHINANDEISARALSYQQSFVIYWAVCAFFTGCFYLLTTSIVERRASV